MEQKAVRRDAPSSYVTHNVPDAFGPSGVVALFPRIIREFDDGPCEEPMIYGCKSDGQLS